MSLRLSFPRPAALALGAAFALAGCDAAAPDSPDAAGPLATADARLEGQYIVVLRDDAVGRAEVPAVAGRLVAAQRGQLRHTYSHALRGFTARLSEEAVAALRADPNVAFVEADQPVYATATQSNATWGLDRIDQRARPLSTTYTYEATGAGVTAYVLDTGIRFDHGEFGGRAVSGYDAVDGGSADDCNGHGTHVAGTIGGATYGVAKGVALVAVRVLGCNGSGSTSGVIAGIDWVTQHHQAGAPAVANMSLGGGASSALDAAVRNSIADGVTYALAAGNSNANACNTSPARTAEAVTVGATTSTDARASYSNYGSCVDLFAPGSSITSAWYTGAGATNTISGTSMAAPHVAGAAALLLQGSPGSTPQQVRDALVAAATPGIVTSSNSTNNHLLYVGTEGPPPPPPPSTLSLSATGRRTGSRSYADLTWSGATTSSVRVYRNDAQVATTSNDGAYSDNIGRVRGTFSYRVCESTTGGACSNTVSVTL